MTGLPDRYSAMMISEAGAMPELVERPLVAPGPGEVVVRMRATTMNFHDLVNLKGLIRGPWPRVPMSDGAGEIAAIGPGVRRVAVGDRVNTAFHPTWLAGRPTPARKRHILGDTCDGCLQQYVTISAEAVIKVPAHLSDIEAATLPCAGLTAWSSLREGACSVGDVVVAQGTGGVSLAVVQLAKAHGATVILTSRSDAKLAVGATLGADHLVNTTQFPEWHLVVRELTGGRGADIVVDVGGSTSLGRSVQACAMDGTVAIVGVLGGFGGAEIPVGVAMMANIHLVGITVGSVADHEDLCRTLEVTGIRPYVSHTLAWTEMPEAMRIMEANEHIGKIAVTIP
jgi:NADPH:quinone reductase-like Zn-dependent oxidoreductase